MLSAIRSPRQHDSRDRGAGRQDRRFHRHPADGNQPARSLPRIPFDTEVIYPVMIGPAVLTFVKELGEHLSTNRPAIFGFIDSIEAVQLDQPQLAYLDNTYF